MKIEFQIPVKVVSEANRSRHEHWGSTRRRAAKQLFAACQFTLSKTTAKERDAVRSVTLTRIGARLYDADNNVAAMKHVQDGVAKALGVDDGDGRIAWNYSQEKSASRNDCGVRVTLE